MKKWCLLAAALTAGCSPAPKPETAWLGHLVPLSGPGRDGGEEAVRAVALAMGQAREADVRVVGRPVGVRHVDSARSARAEATRLLAVNGVCALIVGPGVPDVSEVVAAARPHGAAVFVLDEVADVPDQPGVVLLGPDPARRGEKLADVARGRGRVAVVVEAGRPVCLRLAEAFLAARREQRAEAKSWAAADALARPEVVAAWKPDAVLLAVPAAALRDAKKWSAVVAGREVLYGGEDGAHEWGELLKGERIAGLTAATAYDGPGGLTDEGKALAEALGKRRGEPAGRASVLALDAARLALRALNEAGEAEPRKVRDWLHGQKEWQTLTGPATREGGRPLFVVRAKPE